MFDLAFFRRQRNERDLARANLDARNAKAQLLLDAVPPEALQQGLEMLHRVFCTGPRQDLYPLAITLAPALLHMLSQLSTSFTQCPLFVMQDACVVCGSTEKDLQPCPTCNVRRYCSEDCQVIFFPMSIPCECRQSRSI